MVKRQWRVGLFFFYYRCRRCSLVRKDETTGRRCHRSSIQAKNKSNDEKKILYKQEKVK